MNIQSWISNILSTDPSIYENAYWGSRPDKVKVVPILISLLETVHDSYSRGKIIELLGESEDSSVISLLEVESRHPDQRIRDWANGAIVDLNKGEKWEKVERYLS